MSKYQLKVQKLILKKGGGQVVDDFYNYQAVFLFLFSVYTDQNSAIQLPKVEEIATWHHHELQIGAEDTRQLYPVSFEVEVASFEQLALRINLVQRLKDSFDQWGALKEHLKAQKGTYSSTDTLNSIQLAEVIVPAVLIEQPTMLHIQNEWLELKFQIIKQSN